MCCFSNKIETTEHLFSTGELANQAWNFFANSFGISALEHLTWRQKCLKWWVLCKGKTQDKILASLIPIVLLWEIWLLRNERRHVDGEKVMNMNNIINKVLKWLVDINVLIEPAHKMSFSGEIVLNHLKIPQVKVRIRKPILVQWQAPQSKMLKMNIDGASKGNPGNAGCGEFLGYDSNNFAEMSAMFYGLLICYPLSIHRIVIETDSMLLVHWFNKKAKPPWKCLELWKKIEKLLEYIDVTISHIYREGNGVADLLAKQGSNGISKTYFQLP